MIRWLLSWLFPLWALLPRAQALGAVSFQEVAGAGWMCTIRPPHTAGGWSRRGLNSWSGNGLSLGASLRDALAVAAEVGRQTNEGSPCAPKLGGAEFDED